MRKDTGAAVVQDAVGQPDTRESGPGTLLGWYTTGDGRRRHIRLVDQASDGLCIVDAGDEDAVLIEPGLEDFSEVRAIAADYLELAAERGEPQSRHPWPTSGEANGSNS